MKRFLSTLALALAACTPSNSPSVLSGDGGVCGFFGEDCRDGTCCPESYACPGPLRPTGDCEFSGAGSPLPDGPVGRPRTVARRPTGAPR